MLWMPASAAFFRQAAPDSESRLTIISTWTPLLIMPSQIVPNLATSPSAFWMSDSMPASSKACCSDGRSLASHRGEVVESGRITPTLPALSPLAAVTAVTAVGRAVAAARGGGEHQDAHAREGRHACPGPFPHCLSSCVDGHGAHVASITLIVGEDNICGPRFLETGTFDLAQAARRELRSERESAVRLWCDRRHTPMLRLLEPPT